LLEFNRRIRKLKDDGIVDLILFNNGKKYVVQLENGDQRLYKRCDIPRWILYLYEQGIMLDGREYEYKEPIQDSSADAEVAEILAFDKSRKYLIRFKGDTMAQAQWCISNELDGCEGLISSFWKEVKDGRSLKTMRPTKRWIMSQGAGSRIIPKYRKYAKKPDKLKCGDKYTKNPTFYKKKVEKLLYKQSCLYDSIDSVFPNKLPKSCARYLRNASKKDLVKFEKKLIEILNKYNTQLHPTFLLNMKNPTQTLGNLIRNYTGSAVFVIYRTSLDFHTGLLKFGQIKPYEIRNHSHAKKRNALPSKVDYQEEFKSAMSTIPDRVAVFSLQEKS